MARPGQHVQIEILVHALVAVGRRRAQAAADDGTALNVDIQAVLGLLPQLVGLLGDLDIGALAVHLAVVGGIAGVLAPKLGPQLGGPGGGTQCTDVS